MSPTKLLGSALKFSDVIATKVHAVIGAGNKMLQSCNAFLFRLQCWRIGLHEGSVDILDNKCKSGFLDDLCPYPF